MSDHTNMKNSPASPCASMDARLDIFERAGARVRPLLADRQIEAHVGCWHESAVLKLQKRRWTNQPPLGAPSDAGVFFSVWIDAKGLKQGRAFYNIHALKLRSLEGHSIQSRDFAAAFRSAFSASASEWPNVSTDYGPQTLMQGWIALDPARLENDVAVLARRFVTLAPLIDTLLDQRVA